MKTNSIWIVATAALMLTSCDKDERVGREPWNGEIRLSSGVQVQSRATSAVGDTPTDKALAPGERVGVYIFEEVDEETQPPLYKNLQYEVGRDGSLTLVETVPAQPQPYYPASGNKVKIMAYHPFVAGEAYTDLQNKNHQAVVQTDQSTAANYYSSDFSNATVNSLSRSHQPQLLTFNHRFSKVVCTLKQGVGKPDLTGATVSVCQAVYKDSDPSPKSDIALNSTLGAPATDGSASYIGIIPEQEFRMDEPMLKVHLQTGEDLYYKPTTNVYVKGGEKYTYHITASEKELTVTSETNQPWVEGQTHIVQTFTVNDLKVGDFYCEDGSVSDGGLRAIYEDGTFLLEKVPIAIMPGADAIGMVMQVGRAADDGTAYNFKNGVPMDKVTAYVLALADGWGENYYYWSKDPRYFETTEDDYGYCATAKIIGMCESLDAIPAIQEAIQGPYVLSRNIPAPKNSCGWYLPSKKEGEIWLKNREIIKKCLQTSYGFEGRTTWEEKSYWLSTERVDPQDPPHYTSRAYYMEFRDKHPQNTIQYYDKMGYGYVRSMLVFGE
ncbi:MAG: fimbrillin family protein [Alistipes sp.]